MPLFKIENIDSSTLLGIWKIEEPAVELRSLARLTGEEETQYNSFKNETRKKQWLSCRILLNRMLPGENPFLIYDENGKPEMKERNLFISISHSGEYAAVIVGRSTPVGIDIERIAGRIERIRSRFLDTEEEMMIGDENRLEKLYILWGAKEALYKLHGKPEVDLQHDIHIEPFDYLCCGKGWCRGWMKTPRGKESYSVFYEGIAGYMLVYAMNS